MMETQERQRKLTYATQELLAYMEADGGLGAFVAKLMASPDQCAEDIAVAVHTAIQEFEDNGWECPISKKGCKSNCGAYGCGN